jgi:hypothetical protein
MSHESGMLTDIQAFYREQIRFGASNIDAVREAVDNQSLSPDQYSVLANAYMKGMNSKLSSCFPRDAFEDNLRALMIVAKYILPRKTDLDVERANIMHILGLPPEKTDITTKEAYQHFHSAAVGGSLKRNPTYYQLVTSLMTDYIAESVRRGVVDRDATQLARVIPMMKLLAYVHKAFERIHYGCENEFDVIARWGFNPEEFKFIILTQEQSIAQGEVTSKDMRQ